MTEYQARVYEELADLKTDYAKLQAFTKSPTFRGLAIEEQALMTQQSMAMWNYLHALQGRVDLWARRAG
jgi:hypothetical protein